MKRCMLILLTVIFFCGIRSVSMAKTSQPVSEAREGNHSIWTENFKADYEKAKKQDKVLLLFFTGSDWCGWCKKLDAEILSQKEFISYARKNFVCVKVDFPQRIKQSDALKKQNEQLSKIFRISGFPTLVFVNNNGTILGKKGYERCTPEQYVRSLNEMIATVRGNASSTLSKKDVRDGWSENFEQVAKMSAAMKKPIFIYFASTAADNALCRKFEKEVIHQSDFRKSASEIFCLMKVDFPSKYEQSDDLKRQNANLVKQYGISEFPAVLILSCEGKVLAKMGYLEGGPKKYLEEAVNQLNKTNTELYNE